MSFSRSQKKYLKKNLFKIPLSKIASEFSISENQLIERLREYLPKNKYEQVVKPSKNLELLKKENFSFREFFNQHKKILALLGFFVVAVYINSLGNDFVADDIPGIKENQNIGNFSHLFSEPLSFLRDFFYYFIYKLFGLQPIFYRILNIFFHLGSTFLVYILVSLIGGGVLGLFTSLIFAVHPIETEAITWISGGPYSQYSFFLLLSFLLYFVSERNKSIKLYLLSLFAFLFSLLSTEKAAVLPIILFSFELSLGNLKQNWKKIMPFFTLSIIWFILFISQGLLTGRVSTLQQNYYQEPGLANPLLQIPIAISYYFQLIFIPIKLTLYQSEMSFSLSQYLIRLTVFLVYIALTVFFYKKNRQLFFWLSLFFISLLPLLTPLKISSIVAERYVYLGSLGIFTALGIILTKIGDLTKNKKVPYIILVLLILVLSIRTIIRNSDWKNQDTLWLSAAKYSPSSAQNHNNLGDYYGRQGNLEKAAQEFKIAISLQPNYGDAYHNLANIYHEMKKEDLAIENYKKALQFNPRLWQSSQNLAAIYYQQGKMDIAEIEIENAININPNNSQLHAFLGVIYYNQNKIIESKKEFEESLKIDSQNKMAQEALSAVSKELTD